MKRRLFAAATIAFSMMIGAGCSELANTPGASGSQVEPSPISLAGASDTVTPKIAIAGGMTIFRLSHEGSSNFVVWLLNSAGEKTELLANEVGAFSGATGVGLDKGDYALEVDANATWSVKVEQPRPTSAEETKSFSGKGKTVAGPFKLGGSKTFSMTHTGSKNYIVWLLDREGEKKELLANKIGTYSGSKSGGSSGIYYLNIAADGDWTVNIQ